jgi:regulator of RNase E activity RraA
MQDSTLFEHLRRFDTPTIVNALEIVLGGRFTTGFTRRTLIAAFPKLPSIVGYARTAMIRSAHGFDPAVRRQKQIAYYENLARGPHPTIAVVQDIDHEPGLGAFWGEVNTHIHRGLGCHGAITNGSMRDLDAMQPEFQCLSGSLSPSHAFVHVVEVGVRVDVFGMAVDDGDIVHADRHGAVRIPQEALAGLPDAIDLMARRERVILDAARAPGFDAAKLKAALEQADTIKR